MKHVLRFSVVFLFLLVERVLAQSFAIPDPAFRAYLASVHPEVLTPQQQLDLNKAAAFSGEFYCYGTEIESLEGIQYFTNITTLNCFKNRLKTLPNMSALTKLSSIQAYENQISTLPSLTKLKNLKSLNLGDNKLEEFPIVDSLQNLTELQIYRNLLTSIPDLTSLTGLSVFTCYENRLTKIGKMPASLKDFTFGTNLITSFPDISLARDITAIRGYSNHIESIPDLASYTKIVDLNMGTNRIALAPASLSALQQLSVLTLDNNLLTTLPDLSSLLLLTTFKVENNRLTFEDLLPSSVNPNANKWIIGPQDSIPIQKKFVYPEYSRLTINLATDSLVSGLTYSWYHNGTLRTETSQPRLEIPSLNVTDQGYYNCLIKSSNSAVSALTLTSQRFYISLIPKPDKQRSLSLTPNGDGKEDEFYFEEIGRLKIFDAQGKLLDQLQSPCYWNGTVGMGRELGTGYYLVQFNEEYVYRVTIIR